MRATIKPTTKQTRSIRKWIAWRLVDLAKLVDPGNDNAKSFLTEKIIEFTLEEMKHGRGSVKIDIVKNEDQYKESEE